MGEHTIIYQPQIIRETAEGLNRLDIRDEMLSRRELELMTSVDAESCAAVIRGLLYLQHHRSTRDALHQQPGWRGAKRPCAL